MLIGYTAPFGSFFYLRQTLSLVLNSIRQQPDGNQDLPLIALSVAHFGRKARDRLGDLVIATV